MTCNCRLSFEIFTCRRILSLMVITGFILNSILKTALNIAIVAMIKHNNQTESENTFDWNENEKQNIIGVFFWGFALTKIPSGRLAETVGPRKVWGYSMVLAALLTILTPVVAHWNYYILLSSRVILGFLIGASWPAIMPLAAKWIPPKEQSVFIASVASTALGVAISFHLCGFLIATYGWPSVFYATGGGCLVWCLAWFYLIYDSPQEHPRISFEERHIIEIQIDPTNNKKKLKFKEVPWKKICKSGPVWAIVAGQIATFFTYTTFCNELPSYMHQVLHLDIEQNGIFSGVPYWGGYAAALISGYIADEIRKSGKMSTTAVRKLFESLALFIPSICMVMLGLWGYKIPVALTAFTLGISAGGINTAGHCANILDISPNFAGTICGIVNSVASIGAYLSTQLVAMLLRDNQTFDEWRYLFWVLFTVDIAAAILYLIFASGELQPWDSQNEKKTPEDEKELEFLKEKRLE